MWATEGESRAEIIGWYQRTAAHADATIDALALDSPGRVPWWTFIPKHDAAWWENYRARVEQAAREFWFNV
jgi:hypothetical protein